LLLDGQTILVDIQFRTKLTCVKFVHEIQVTLNILLN